MLPPPLPHQVQVLQNVLDRVSVAAVDGGPTPIVVFGIDGALFDSRPRTLQVLHDYADEMADDADVAGALRSLTVDHVHYLLSETLRECAITHAEHVRAITSFWRDRFHTDEYVVLDEPTPGAVDYVRAIHEAGGSVILISGRDVHGMLLGTVQSLRDHGMPIADVGVERCSSPTRRSAPKPSSVTRCPASRGAARWSRSSTTKPRAASWRSASFRRPASRSSTRGCSSSISRRASSTSATSACSEARLDSPHATGASFAESCRSTD
ncbi:MAG: hypothetical protein R3B99_01445 [Polyangiales bacterium]